MDTETTGIILKTFFPKKMKMVLLDAQLGKIEGVPPHEQFSCGSLLSYNARPKGNLYFLSEIHVIDVPLALARDDILFLHHILEICYFCAPFDANVPEIFNLLQQIYPQLANPLGAPFKIAFLFKLLVSLGMHPQESQFQDSYYFMLARESIDTIVQKSLHLNTKQALHAWVYACISLHPLIHIFKTMHFFTDR